MQERLIIGTAQYSHCMS